MDHCKTCKHWKPFIEEFPNHPSAKLDLKPKYFSGGICKSEKLCEEYSFDYYQPDRLVYPYTEGGYFWTGPDFGCVNHEDKS